ncbi:MAG: DUF1638 domain-containing protein [Bacteroidetes bacterium]|jgi:hypothetical protein|nr:DUF1638 domain-containing protein [Bacteroidota bacterium]
MDKPEKIKIIIACGSIKPEINRLNADIGNKTEVIFFDQGLHRIPHKMPDILQETIDEIADRAEVETIVLGYGLCSNGVVGLKAPRQGLIIPRAHDCIAFFLGSRQAYHRNFKEFPGTYYLSKSWIDNQKDPIGLMKNEYTERVGPEDAEWAMKEEIKHYSQIAFINTIPEEANKYRKVAQMNADYFQKKYKEYKGEPTYILKILNGPYDDDFVHIPPGELVKQKYFINH